MNNMAGAIWLKQCNQQYGQSNTIKAMQLKILPEQYDQSNAINNTARAIGSEQSMQYGSEQTREWLHC